MFCSVSIYLSWKDRKQVEHPSFLSSSSFSLHTLLSVLLPVNIQIFARWGDITFTGKLLIVGVEFVEALDG